MSADLTVHLRGIGAALAERMPTVLDAATSLLESILPALDAARPERYEIGPKIGAGGMAEVFLGTVRGAAGFRRPVAVKRVRADRADEARLATALAEEAHLASQLSHPNVVSVLDFDRDQTGQFCLIMEYVDGIDLASLIETGPVPYPVAIFIVRELLAGLGYIHKLRGRGRLRGLVHRDVTPHNVLLSWAGELKLADFGLAQVLERSTSLGANALGGTAGYMSPEQVNGQALDGRSDLYAVGVVLWEMLALRPLRAGTGTIFQLIPRPSEYRQGIPADLEAVALRLLAYDRDERYPTAELAAHVLMRCQDNPRDGREALVRLLDERFPLHGRRRPTSCPPGQGTPSKGACTATAPSAPMAAPSASWPTEQGDGQPRADEQKRARRRRGLVFCVLIALVVAVTVSLLVAR